MGVNLGAIAEKVNHYANSPAGKQKMAQAVQKIREGKGAPGSSGRTQAGDIVITYEQMQSAAKELITIIRKHAASANLPNSVMAHVESFCDSALIVNTDGSASIAINMLDNPGRPSVQPDLYAGAYNIVALFNAGYTAKDSVYGFWETAGHDILTLKHRDGVFFLQNAINEFNSKYAEKYNVSVRLDGIYG